MYCQLYCNIMKYVYVHLQISRYSLTIALALFCRAKPKDSNYLLFNEAVVMV